MVSPPPADIWRTVVFADGRNGGNPCPVVLDAGDLTVQDGMALATHYQSESVLVSNPTEKQPRFGLRYFVPHQEMEMCVHGTIAAVTVLHAAGRARISPMTLATALGDIATHWRAVDSGIAVTVKQFPPAFAGRNPAVKSIARVLRLSDEALIRRDLPCISVSTARAKLIVPMVSAEAVQTLEPDFEALWSLCDDYDITGLYPFAAEAGGGSSDAWIARQFPRRAGYNEDPATGVAACALGAYLCQYSTRQEGWNEFRILQGHAMGRPSRLATRIRVAAGEIIDTCVVGTAMIVDGPGVSAGQCPGS